MRRRASKETIEELRKTIENIFEYARENPEGFFSYVVMPYMDEELYRMGGKEALYSEIERVAKSKRSARKWVIAAMIDQIKSYFPEVSTPTITRHVKKLIKDLEDINDKLTKEVMDYAKEILPEVRKYKAKRKLEF